MTPSPNDLPAPPPSVAPLPVLVDPGPPTRTPFGSGRFGNPDGTALTWGPGGVPSGQEGSTPSGQAASASSGPPGVPSGQPGSAPSGQPGS